MADFQQRAEAALLGLFHPTPTNKRCIDDIAKRADELRTTLERGAEYDLELTVDLIVKHLEKRSNGGPKWAWNNWIGSLEYIGAVPEGYQI